MRISVFSVIQQLGQESLEALLGCTFKINFFTHIPDTSVLLYMVSCSLYISLSLTLFSSAPLPHNVARFWEMHIVAISYLKAFGALDYQDVSIEDRISLFLGMVFIVLGTTDIPSSFPHLGYGKFCEAVYGIST